ncbi:hypothetical protein QVD17_04564 [Tagetes erecta]|uniref:S-protein homolog n=1 Tax=Tagetes erecta TaxID=13708 RepID=A0AAD8PAI0_TARER|nr:hypothetical protein QVD17_04564 [Tagetes erecta]
MLSFCIASSPNTIYELRMYVTNSNISDNIVVHAYGSDDQGNHSLAKNEEFDWKFGVKFGTHYQGEFWWGSRYKSIALYNDDISASCFNGDVFRVQRCYWLVREDGFWNHGRNVSFPGGWTRRETW